MSSITGQSIQNAPALIDALIDKHNSKISINNTNLLYKYSPETEEYTDPTEEFSYYKPPKNIRNSVILKPSWSGLPTQEIVKRCLTALRFPPTPVFGSWVSSPSGTEPTVDIDSSSLEPFPDFPSSLSGMGDYLDFLNAYYDLHTTIYYNLGVLTPHILSWDGSSQEEGSFDGVTFFPDAYNSGKVPDAQRPWSHDKTWDEVIADVSPIVASESSTQMLRIDTEGTRKLWTWDPIYIPTRDPSEHFTGTSTLVSTDEINFSISLPGGLAGTLDTSLFQLYAYYEGYADGPATIESTVTGLGSITIPTDVDSPWGFDKAVLSSDVSSSSIPDLLGANNQLTITNTIPTSWPGNIDGPTIHYDEYSGLTSTNYTSRFCRYVSQISPPRFWVTI